jgi:4,5-DOPA dioxygenase extradiol
MPALFIGHGSPMNAIEDNAFSQAWGRLGKTLPKPDAILCVSAHWETAGTQATAMAKPRTIHDFFGFPQALFDVEYPAPGSPALAEALPALAPVALDHDWGLDHGAWSILCRLFPDADIPVVQLSLDRAKTPADHYALGQALRPLRQQGVLIIGSGNIVHNLRRVRWQDAADECAQDFDAQIKRLILAGEHQALIQFDQLGEAARLAIPSPEHFLPLLYILGLQEPGENIAFFNEAVTLGSIAMRSLIVGPE